MRKSFIPGSNDVAIFNNTTHEIWGAYFMETLEEIIKVVVDLNERSLEFIGAAYLSVITDGCGADVLLFGQLPLWSSDEDDRELVGVCETCKGSGQIDVDVPVSFLETTVPGTLNVSFTLEKEPCPSCGGDGKGEPRESLYVYLSRELLTLANDLQEASRPRNDSETPLPHDKETL